MSIKGDVLLIAVLGIAVVAAAYYAKKKIGAGIASLTDLVPEVVQEGFGAASVLAWSAADVITDPLDGFGIRPGVNLYGDKKWRPIVPWENPDDVVSNNDTGMNFNYF